MINHVWDSQARRLRVRGKQSGSYLESGLIAAIMTETELLPVPYAGALQSADGLRLTGEGHGFTAEATWKAQQGTHCHYYDVTLQLVHTGSSPVEAGVQVSLGLAGAGRPTWLVPGSFYRENRLQECERMYPRWDYEGGDPLQLVSDSWSFRADRAALPAVFGWNDQLCGAMQTAEMSAVGLTGMGFVGNATQTAVWLNFPYREEPVVFAAPGKPEAPDCPLYRWQPNQPVTLRYRVYVGDPDLHAYDPFVRELYDLDREGNPLHPWMGLTEAAELSAHGLYTWHYKPAEALLYETATFDREGSGKDRPNMHVAWVSGVPYAYALLTYGRRHERFEYTIAAQRVIDKIASGIAPCGTFYGEWRADRGWSQGWTPNRQWLHTRTLAEATLFMLRALRFETEQGIEHPAWRDAVLSNLRYVVSHQSREGSFGTYYHMETGEVVEWTGAGGILWIAGLVEGAAFFNEPSFLVAAKQAGQYYAHYVADEFIYGAPEDVHLAPTSEDGYNATVAYLLLYEADREAQWLKLAARAADWTMTFRWTYNLTFPRHSMLAQFDFRSRGADHASPSNQHLHNYGLFALPEMMRLAAYTGDGYYRERTRDNLACFLQFIAREDGDFNAYKGMITERYYNTHCFQPKGMMLTLSHAWSVGLTLYAAQEAERYLAELEGIAR
ncbi:MAG: hypothetical protein ACM3XM_11340 [Mycobacterium leprae]